MATLVRNPLALRHTPSTIHQYASTAIRKALVSPAPKRPLSPEPGDIHSSNKRIKAVPPSPTATTARDEAKKEKERKRAEREHEFRVKYTRAFPNWVFYFDLDAHNPDVATVRMNLERRVSQLGARVEDFFSRDITHLITLHYDDVPANKENVSRARPGGLLASPIKLRGRATSDASGAPPDNLVQKALAFDIKVWSADKLDSVLNRCQALSAHAQAALATPAAPQATASTSKEQPRSLTRLLQSERLHGTYERDPTQKRHDYTYFAKGTYFVLVEDMKQELATIAALEYPIAKGRDGRERGNWPVLHCHPDARGPFVEYDEREAKRKERAEKVEHEREQEQERRKAKIRERERQKKAQAEAQARLLAKRHGDLRRSVSMNNMQRHATYPDACLEGLIDLDADECDTTMESANASGFLASGTYMAASGNSVGITSTTGTTSTGRPFRNIQLPASLRGRLQQQVVTSRKAPTTVTAESKENIMGPPLIIPERPNRILRKARSTNTLRLPKREEGTKPGYCECCRVKFADFKEHINGRRHAKYAMDDANFAQLDYALSRVRRRTREEVQVQKRRCAERSSPDYSDDRADDEDDILMLSASDIQLAEDVKWDDWVDADGL